MPEDLKICLCNVSADSAKAIWDYLDGNANALSEMIDIVAPIASVIDNTVKE